MVVTFKSDSWELLNLCQDSLRRCDLVIRVDWIRNFWLFTWLEPFGYLREKLVVLDKYCVPDSMEIPANCEALIHDSLG